MSMGVANREEVLETGRRGIHLYCFGRPGAAADDCRSLVVNQVAGYYRGVCLDDFEGPMAPARFQDPAWLAAEACRHERVIQALMAQSPVLPIRFGAVFSGPQALEELLARQGEAVCRFLDQVADKQEWAVKLFLEVEHAGECLLSAEAHLARRRRQLSTAPGTRYFQEKRLHAAALTEARSRGRKRAQHVHDVLQALASKVCVLPLRSANRPGLELFFHGACLVPSSGVDRLRGFVDDMQAPCRDQGLILELTGPWPAYHFCPCLSEEATP